MRRPACLHCRLGPQHAERTPSRPIWEVKQRRAPLVPACVSGWEYRVPKPEAFAQSQLLPLPGPLGKSSSAVSTCMPERLGIPRAQAKRFCAAAAGAAARPIGEVKQRRALLVPAGVSGWEYRVPKPEAFAQPQLLPLPGPLGVFFSRSSSIFPDTA